MKSLSSEEVGHREKVCRNNQGRKIFTRIEHLKQTPLSTTHKTKLNVIRTNIKTNGINTPRVATDPRESEFLGKPYFASFALSRGEDDEKPLY